MTTHPYTRLFPSMSTAPSVTDDSNAGYEVGDVWIDGVGGVAYQAVDVTPGAAVWTSGVGAVDSVNGHTGVVVLDPDDLDDSATINKFITDAELIKLAGIEAGAEVNDPPYNLLAEISALTDVTAQLADRLLIIQDSSGTLKTFLFDEIVGLIDSGIASASALIIHDSAYDASGNLNYPSATRGWTYYVSVAGKVGGSSGRNVYVGDVFFAIQSNSGGSEAAVGSAWATVLGAAHLAALAMPLSYLDTDGALAANSDVKIASQKATKTYVDNAVTGLFDFKGTTDCSANPNYPSALKSDAYVVSVAGKIGGASGKSVGVGDWYVATADNAGGTEASVGTSWTVFENNIRTTDDVIEGATNKYITAANLWAVATGLTATTPVDGDYFFYIRTASGDLRKVTMSSFRDSYLRTNLDTIYALTAKGVTNGDSHDHNGGDGAQISFLNLSNSFNDGEGNPADVGTAADGTSNYGARRDHVHATANGSAVLGADYQITASDGTYADTGLSITLPSAGTYLITGTVRGAIQGTTANAFIVAKLYNSTDSADISNSETLVIFQATANTLAQNSVAMTALVTVAASKTIKLYAFRSGGGTYAFSHISSNSNGRTRLQYEKIG